MNPYEEILIPNLGDVNPAGVEVSAGSRAAFRPEAQFNDAAWSSSSSAALGGAKAGGDGESLVALSLTVGPVGGEDHRLPA